MSLPEGESEFPPRPSKWVVALPSGHRGELGGYRGTMRTLVRLLRK